MHAQIVYPMVFYVFYVFALALYNFRTRVGAAKSGQIQFKYFRAMTGTDIPERVIVVGRHYDHQFELPMLFFTGCCAFMAIGRANELTVIFAWAFIVTRLLHSYVHLGSNNVRQRFSAFAASWLMVLLLWGQLGILAYINS